MIVDVHAHLDHERFISDLDAVIQRAKDVGVVSIITQGVNHSTNIMALKLSKKYDIVKCAMGAFPIDVLNKEVGSEGFARDVERFDIDEEIKFITKHKKELIAVGEVGMDFKMSDEKEKQKENFAKIIEMSEKIKKPMIIHSRKAELEIIEMLESYKIKNVVMHCFGGKMKLVKRCIDNGYFFSIPTVITRLKHFQEVVKLVPNEKILTETDAPYLSPYKLKRNEPSFIVETLKIIAEIKSLNVKEVENLIFKNYQQVFLMQN